MNINRIGAGYPAWREMGKEQKKNLGTGFADRTNMAGSFSSQRTSIRATGQNSVLEAYRASVASEVRNVKPAYETYESENYKIVPDNEAGCFDIYNKQGEKLGAFNYSDIKIRQDSTTGKQFLISEHGTMSYDAMVMDGELKKALQNVMGAEALETEELQGYTLKTHSGTGIQYLVRDGEEGRGGKVLLQSQADIEKYEALAETYFNKYPNLVHDRNAGYIWADLEIKGLAQHTNNGIVSMGFDGMSYNDNSDYKNNWSVLFSGDTYKLIFAWLQNNRESIEEIQKFSAGQATVGNGIMGYPAWGNAKKMENTAVNSKFLEQMNNTAGTSDISNVDVYRKYLESKYGKVTIKDVPKDQETLEKLGKSMGGNDVVIAPNILEEMANDPEKAAYYEQKIDYFFNTIIPRETAFCAARGLVFEPAGVVVHKDGTVTYICGCSDSPERVAQVNAINKAKREKRAAQREAAFERSREEAAARAQEFELIDKKRNMAQALAGYSAHAWETADLDVFYIGLGSN